MRDRTRPRRAPRPRVSEPLALALLAAALSTLFVAFVPPGTDFAAHAYQSALFAKRGFAIWDNGWYAGRYTFITYSVLYYPLAATFGIALVAVGSQAIAVGAFAAVLRDRFGRRARWSARTFAITWPAFLMTAAFPSGLGIMLGLLAVRALQRRRTALACVLCALTLAASPLAFVLLAIVLAGIALGERVGGRALLVPALTIAALGALEVVLWKIFPSRGRSPFPLDSMVTVVALSAGVVWLTWGVASARAVLWLFAVYGLATVASYVVTSPLGSAITRLEFIALPMAVLALSLTAPLWRSRFLALATIGLAGWLNLAPLASSFVDGVSTSAWSAAYWQPAVAFLRAHPSPAYRVEAVDTVGHWPALQLARAGIPLARGWFRQDDFPQNALLYKPTLTPAEYVGWLRRMAVRYVVLPDARLDYSSHGEAMLLRSGRAGLPVVLRAPHLTIYELPRARPIVTGPAPARVLSMRQSGILLALPRAGTYRVAIRYTPYWGVSSGCVRQTSDGMTSLSVAHAGRLLLAFDWTPEGALDVAAGGPAACATAVTTAVPPRDRGLR